MAAVTRAAGGVLWRSGGSAAPADRQVCLVHRPRYDDWSLPKGKLSPGEHPLAAAVREVAEETGVDAVPQLPLPAARYRSAGAEKHVSYWAMVGRSVTGGGAGDRVADSEVDDVVWLPVAAALRRLTYPRDVDLVRSWAALPPVTGVALLVRHAEAVSREAWPAAADGLRPLTATGDTQAQRLCRLLDLFSPTRLVSASPLRCRRTLAPLARARRLDVDIDPAFDELNGDPATARDRLARSGSIGGTTVVCSQGGVIPPVLGRLAEAGGAETAVPDEAGRRSGWATAKGDGWLLSFSGPLLVAVAPLRLADGAVLS